jgi:hypothetical protein
MSRKPVIGAALLLIAFGAGSTQAEAQYGRRQGEMDRLYALCEQNYKPACIRFGIMIGENRGRQQEWRREHPNWYWWERW